MKLIVGNLFFYTRHTFWGTIPICFEEPFGLSVAEAMMSGTPVIAFNRGSMPELIMDGKTGFLVKDVAEATKAVGKLSTIDPQFCRDHAIKKFSIDRMVDDYSVAYHRVISGVN